MIPIIKIKVFLFFRAIEDAKGNQASNVEVLYLLCLINIFCKIKCMNCLMVSKFIKTLKIMIK